MTVTYIMVIAATAMIAVVSQPRPPSKEQPPEKLLGCRVARAL
jgi:hypothetical protein